MSSIQIRANTATGNQFIPREVGSIAAGAGEVVPFMQGSASDSAGYEPGCAAPTCSILGAKSSAQKKKAGGWRDPENCAYYTRECRAGRFLTRRISLLRAFHGSHF
jgi:hypothetical protein